MSASAPSASKYDVWINWELIAELVGWYGTIDELKRSRLEDPRKPRFQAPKLR